MGDLGPAPLRTPHPNKENAVSDLPTIDLDAIANLRDLNPGDGGEFLREIVTIYLEDTPKRIADMRSTLAAGDTGAFARAAAVFNISR